jgi:hypothetical protein
MDRSKEKLKHDSSPAKRPKRKKMPQWVLYLASLITESLNNAFAIGVGFASLLYVFTRVFIVLEAFLSLRLIPVDVYKGVTWAQYIPHI